MDTSASYGLRVVTRRLRYIIPKSNRNIYLELVAQRSKIIDFHRDLLYRKDLRTTYVAALRNRFGRKMLFIAWFGDASSPRTDKNGFDRFRHHRRRRTRAFRRRRETN